MGGYAQGIESFLAIAGEKTWGTISAAPAWEYDHIISNGVKPMKAPFTLADIYKGRYQARHLRGPLRVNGPVKWTVGPDGFLGRMLYCLLGADSVTDHGASNGGTHVFTPSAVASVPAGFTARFAHDDIAITTDVWECTGGKPLKMTFDSADAKSYLTCQADLAFQDGAGSATTLTPTYPTLDPFPTWGGTITVDSGAFPITQFSLTIDPSVNAERSDLAAANGYIIEPLQGLVKVAGSFTAYFDSLTLVNKILNGTVAGLSVQFTGAAIGASTSKLILAVPNLYYTGEMPTSEGPGEIMLKANFEAVKASASELITATLTNSQRTVYAAPAS